MNRQDFENAINDYLTNSGQDEGLWDVWGASIEMRDRFEVESIDDVDPDEFVSILQKYDCSSEFTDRY